MWHRHDDTYCPIDDASSAVRPERRRLLLGAGAGALLSAAGGIGVARAQSLLTASGTAPDRFARAAAADPTTWERLRDAERAPVLQWLNGTAGGCRRPTSLEPAALAAAVRASLADGKPIKLLPGTTTLRAPLELLAKDLGAKRPVAIFSDGDHWFSGSYPIHTDLPLQFYNCRFEQINSRHLTGQFVHTLLLWFNTFRVSGKHQAVTLYALGADQGSNRLSMKWNDFSGHDFALLANDMNDSLIAHNRCRQSVGRNFQCNGGYGNTFANNIIQGGITGISCAFQAPVAPRSGEFSRAYNQSHFDVVIEGNFLSDISEEAIGFDAFGNNTYLHPIIDQFTLARDLGIHYGKKGTPAQPQILVPINPGAPGIGPMPISDGLYRHYFVVWLNGPLAGKYAQIHHCSAHNASLAAFALRSPRAANNAIRSAADPALRPGELTQEDFGRIANNQPVNICALGGNFRIRDNTIHCRSFEGRYTTPISLWGACSGFEVTGNRLIDAGVVDADKRYAGIRLSHLAGIWPKTNRLDERTAYGNHLRCTMPVAHGRVENNALDGLGLRLANHAYAGASTFIRHTHIATVKNNTGLWSGAPQIADWVDNGGPIHPLVPTYTRSPEYVSGNS